MKLDFLIVGSGLYGSILANELTKAKKKCLVIEKRKHLAGNIYTQEKFNINIHKYGAHIFHTDDKSTWKYINQFAEFNNYINAPIANYKGKIFNLPFNMNTFNQLWGTITPEEASLKLKDQRVNLNHEPRNLEEQALTLIGKDIYQTLIKGYTEKQWGTCAKNLPSFIIKRLPVRMIYDNNYFNDRYQGIPIGGYTQIVENLLKGIEVNLNTNFFDNRSYFEKIASNIIFTGMIDEYFDYKFGPLSYRSLDFKETILNMKNFQGNAVVNYTEYEIPYTRIIEHKHFEFGKQDNTIITHEYPKEWHKGIEPFYPVNDQRNANLYQKYNALAQAQKKVFFGGRLGTYSYYDMDDIVIKAREDAKDIIHKQS